MTYKDTVAMRNKASGLQTGKTWLKPVIAVLLTGTLLGGCANVHNIEVGSVPDDYRTNHPIVISEKQEVVDIPVAGTDHRMTFGTMSIVRGFGQQYRANASGSLTIMRPVGSANARAATRVSKQIRRVLVDEGVPAARIHTTTYQAQGQNDAAPIRLSFGAIAASVEECGRWPKDLVLNTTENKHYENFGCATQNNLAAQIANPSDLIAPRGTTPIDAQRRDNVINDYRENGAGLKNTDADITININQ